MQICEAILDHCLAPDLRMGGLGCDNMTIILICYLNSEPYSHLVTKCSRVTSTTPHYRAHHSWAHKRSHGLVSELNGSRSNQEENLTFGVSPRSQLNDTVSGANTDLDSELAISKEISNEFAELLKVLPNGGADMAEVETRRTLSTSSDDGEQWGEHSILPMEIAPIETMV